MGIPSLLAIRWIPINQRSVADFLRKSGFWKECWRLSEVGIIKKETFVPARVVRRARDIIPSIPEGEKLIDFLGDGFKYFLFSTLPGEMIQFD